MTDLIERLKACPGARHRKRLVDDKLLKEVIAALTPVEDEKVKQIFGALQFCLDGDNTACDLIETRIEVKCDRGELLVTLVDKIMARIEELEHELNDARDGSMPR